MQLSFLMTNWLPIDQAPKDGTPVLLKGGTYTHDDSGDTEDCTPVVCGFWDCDKSYPEWVFAFWDGAWRSSYDNPTHFMLIPE
jgi:hypothetical protein